jgi:hypothetical protein
MATPILIEIITSIGLNILVHHSSKAVFIANIILLKSNLSSSATSCNKEQPLDSFSPPAFAVMVNEGTGIAMRKGFNYF